MVVKPSAVDDPLDRADLLLGAARSLSETVIVVVR